ncbi:hypothetical protein GIB67_027401 [Kingdonia uniflora]|uniref:CCHC-type domain-containing protein n=1 Tax=Kingdonia uniflora TaxID=39325 RepID=A0A7J7MFJ5_9MAGN|nr:hypothetical protein GIB67_027401 [Kingdonia uniflora]
MVISGEISFNKFRKGTCWSCGQSGHYRSDCKVRKGTGVSSVRGSESDTNKLATFTGNNSDEAFLVVSADGSCHDRGWVFDSGATMHVCAHKAWFGKYARCEGNKFVSTSDGSRRPISGVGDIRVRMFDGRTVVLHDVRHVPSYMELIYQICANTGMYSSKDELLEKDVELLNTRVPHGELQLLRARWSNERLSEVSLIMKGVISGNLYALVGKSVGGDMNVACTDGAMEISQKKNLVQGGAMARSTKMIKK